MCNVLVADSILKALEVKVQNGDVFTAYDITREVRNSSADKVPHKDVRNLILNELATGGMPNYSHELCVLDKIAGFPEAFVYSPDGKSAQDHPLISGTDTDNTDTDDGDDVVDLGNDEYETTKEGRVQIPRKLLTQVSTTNGSYEVLVSGSFKSVSADARGDVRVCLKQFGITDNKVKLTVDSTNTAILIDTI